MLGISVEGTLIGAKDGLVLPSFFDVQDILDPLACQNVYSHLIVLQKKKKALNYHPTLILLLTFSNISALGFCFDTLTSTTT